MTYEEQLKDKRWLSLRDEIIERDFGICQTCMSSKNLHVHHKGYLPGRMAWDYPSSFLITLCGTCHQELHESGRFRDEGAYLLACSQLRENISILKSMPDA